MLHRAEEGASREGIEALREGTRAFVHHPRVDDAQWLLQNRHSCLITGAPGVGKTALAGYLALLLAAEKGYEPLYVRDRAVDNARRLLQEGRRQVLILDDFLGAQFLEPEQGLALEQSLLGLIRQIQRGDGEHKLLLTTRDYILQQARRRLERFERDADRLDRVTLEVEALDEWERARILVAHLDQNQIPSGHIRALVTSGTHRRLVQHQNFMPRLVAETAEDGHHQTETDYPRWLQAQFDNPERYWEKAFDHLSPAAQHWLYALAVAGGEGAVDDLTGFFHRLHHELAAQVELNARERALTEVEPNFAISEDIDGTIWLRYATPAIGDLLQRLIDRDDHLKARIIEHLGCLQHGLHLFQLREGDDRPVQTNAALRTRLFEQHLALLHQPAWERKVRWSSQTPRNQLVIPGFVERLIRLWRAWNDRSRRGEPLHGMDQAAERNRALAALADEGLPDDASWQDALARQPYEPLLALASWLPKPAKRHTVWSTALQVLTDTADARALVDAVDHSPELGEYLAREEERFLDAIDDAADTEAWHADDPDHVTDAITNLEVIEGTMGFDLSDARHSLMHRLEELQDEITEDDDDRPSPERGERDRSRTAQLDSLFWQLVEVTE